MYRVIVTPHYYAGTCNAPQAGYARTDDARCQDTGDILEWDTEKEAQAWIDEQLAENDGTYLAHGQYAHDSYSIESDDNMSDDCESASGIAGWFGSEWEEITVDDVPPTIKAELDSIGVDYHRSTDDCDIYTASIEDDDYEYMIAYCPKTLAIERNVDDLRGIDWANEAYYRRLLD